MCLRSPALGCRDAGCSGRRNGFCHVDGKDKNFEKNKRKVEYYQDNALCGGESRAGRDAARSLSPRRGWRSIFGLHSWAELVYGLWK